MHTFLEMSAPDIAQELGLNENTVKSRIARGRADVLAAMKRLRPDERSVLEGMPLLLPLTLEGSSPRGDAASLGRLAQPGDPRGGDAAGGHDPRRRPAGPPRSGGAAPGRARARRARQSRRRLVPRRQRRAAGGAGDTARGARPDGEHGHGGVQGTSLARELVLITAAKHARDRYDYDGALARLNEHEREFPQGSLAKVRDRLRDEVSSARQIRQAR